MKVATIIPLKIIFLHVCVSDERRIAHLMSKFNSPEAAAAAPRGTSSSTTSSGTTKSIVKAEPVYAGGIFSRLEAQFRTQQAARALALQNTQTRCLSLIIIPRPYPSSMLHAESKS